MIDFVLEVRISLTSRTSVQSVEQEKDDADANHPTQNKRVPPLAQIDFLDEVVDGGETI